MIEWLLFDTYSQDLVFKRLSVPIDGMNLDKSLTAKFFRMIGSYYAPVSTLDGRAADTTVCQKKKG